jgi:hypothetical protein
MTIPVTALRVGEALGIGLLVCIPIGMIGMALLVARATHADREAPLADPAAPDQRLLVHAYLDSLGVPTEQDGATLELEARVKLFALRMGLRFQQLVNSNAAFAATCTEALVLLEGSPNSSNFRVREAMKRLRATKAPNLLAPKAKPS